MSVSLDPSLLLAWFPPPWESEAMFQLVLSAVLGGLIGMERQVRGRAAGFRTHLLLCVGCCLVMIVSISFPRFYAAQFPDDVNIVRIDPARLAYSVMGGIGFIGAGAILKIGISVRGLTTAASLWCVAAVGLAVGFGLYWIATFCALLVLASLIALNFVEGQLPSRWHKSLTLVCDGGQERIDQVEQMLRQMGVEIRDLGFNRDPKNGKLLLRLEIAYRDRRLTPRISRALMDATGFESVELR